MHKLVIEQIAALQARIAALQGSAAEAAPNDTALLMEALEQLQTAIEELLVAEEELRDQHNHLVTAQHTLDLERRRYVDLFDGAPNSYIITDQRGIILAANRATATLLQHAPTMFAGKPLVTFIAKLWQNGFWALLGALRATDAVQAWEAQVQPRHGPALDVDVRVVPVADPATGERHLRWLLRDITTRKQAEAARRQSDARFATIFRASPAAIAITRVSDGVFLDVNPSFLALTGYTRAQVVGHSTLEVGVWNDTAAREHMIELLTQCSVAGLELQIRTKSGAVRDLLVAAECIDIDDQPCVLGIFQDITARKQAEAEVHRLNASLEQRVAERTAALKAANLKKDEFLAREQAARQALAESEARYRTITELTTDFVCSFRVEPDHTLMLEWIAGAFTTITGYEEQQLTQSDVWSILVHPEDQARSSQHWATLLAGQDDACDLRIMTKAGQICWIMHHGHAVTDPATGQVVRVISASADITERKQAEAVVHEAQQRLELALDAADMGVWDASLSTGLAQTNLRHDQIFGYAEPVPAWGLAIFREHILPEDQEIFDRAFAQALETGTLDLQVRVCWPDGSLHWINDRGRVSYDRQGRPVRMLGVTIDITERKQAEEERERLMAQVSAERDEKTEILESIGDSFYALDADFHLTYVNRKAEQLWGRRREDLIGKHFWTEFPALVGSESHRRHVEAMQQRQPVHYEALSPILKAWIAVNIFPRIGGGISVYFQDITRRKRAEQERERLLARLVTAQEDERRRLSQELHDEAGRSLTAVQLGLATLHQYTDGNPALQPRLTQLQTLLSQHGRDLHAIARQLRPAALDDQGLCSAVENHLEEWSTRYRVVSDLHCPGLAVQRFPPMVEITIYRVLQEALTNIARHAQAQHVSVILELRNHHLQMIVEDDGCGFEVEDLFNTPETSRGLGLIGMQERIHALGGALDIESCPSHGTTLFVRVPLDTEVEGAYDTSARVSGG